MVLEVHVLARTSFKFLKIQSRDTSPADRSLRFQAMIGSGLMARDTLLCTQMFMHFVLALLTADLVMTRA